MTESFDIWADKAKRERDSKEAGALREAARKAWLQSLSAAERRSYYASQGLKGIKAAGEIALLYGGGAAAILEGHHLLANHHQTQNSPAIEHHIESHQVSRSGTGTLHTEKGSFQVHGIGTAVAAEKQGDHFVEVDPMTLDKK